jgi:hypothetical protein
VQEGCMFVPPAHTSNNISQRKKKWGVIMASALCSVYVRLERIGVGIGRAIAQRGRLVKKAINWLEGRTESVRTQEVAI